MYLSSKPATGQIWDPAASYWPGTYIWYNGCWYQYEDNVNSTPGEKPNEATMTVTYTNMLDYTQTDTRVERSWRLVDPRDPNNYGDADAPKLPVYDGTQTYRVPRSVADIASSVIRGVPALSLQQPFRFDPEDPFSSWQYYNSTPQYDRIGFGFTQAMQETYSGDRNYNYSWRRNLGLGLWGASVDYGLATDGFVGVTAQLQPIGGLTNIPLPQTPTIGIGFGDNQKIYDGLIDHYASLEPASYPPYTTYIGVAGMTAIGATDLSYNIGLPDMTPASAASVASWFGQSVSYRAYMIFYGYEEVEVPGPWDGDPTTTQLLRSGGTLVLVSGDGVNDPYVYEWQGPFEPPFVEFANSGSLTIGDLGDRFNDLVSAGGTRTKASLPALTYDGTYKQLMTAAYVWKTVSPGLESA